MNSQELVVSGISGDTLEAVLARGDLASLTPAQRAEYVAAVCRSLGLNPLTRPLQIITLNGRVVLYATRDATDQLRKLHGVSVEIVGREQVDDLYVVTARATMNNRRDESTGAVALGNLRGDARANALMKAETKAKRRVTLSICGLGILDEIEVGDVPAADHAPKPSEPVEPLEPVEDDTWDLIDKDEWAQYDAEFRSLPKEAREAARRAYPDVADRWNTRAVTSDEAAALFQAAISAIHAQTDAEQVDNA